MRGEHNYILSFYDDVEKRFDVFAKFREKEPLTNEKLKSIIQEVLQNGTIIRDGDGKHHFIEKGETHGQ